MKTLVIFVAALALAANAAGERADDGISFHPIEHATFVIQSKQATIYVDPVGDVGAFENFPSPNIILITDIHRDHLDADVVKAVRGKETVVIGPKAVTDQLDGATTLVNGKSIDVDGVTIEAIPMYNLTKERLQFHTKGRGNGYVVTLNGKRIYISGDTEDIPEMRALKSIDYAFVCMNLPYTMTVDQAASAVLEMKPKVVYSYHYRGADGFSDTARFKELVGKGTGIEVRLLDWYK